MSAYRFRPNHSGKPAWLTRGISEVIDSHDVLIVRVDQRGLFDGHRQEADVLAGIFDGEQNQLIVHGPS
ncbi:hypothetical protein ACFY4H_25705 [Streptomyces althioticus]|uniref:hypothetical protein n=1 Tax=Streptomyces althioticus TaxID=83380 RepID=UPI0036A06A3A